MKQFKTILGFELKNYYKNKIFVGITLLLVAIIGVVMFIPNIFSGGSDNANSNDAPIMLISSEDSDLLKLSNAHFATAFQNYEIREIEANEDKIKAEISEGRAECAFLFDGYSYKYYVNTHSMYDTTPAVADELLTTIYRINAMISGGMSPDQAGEIAEIAAHGEVISLNASQADKRDSEKNRQSVALSIFL